MNPSNPLRHTLLAAAGAAAVLLLLGGPARAADPFTVYVAGSEGPARAAAEKKAAAAPAGTAFVEAKVPKALAKAAELANGAGPRTVRVLVAGGEQKAGIGGGAFVVPAIANPEAALHLLGGFDDAFEARRPFRTPTRLGAGAGRSGPLLGLTPKSQLREVVVSGFLLDGAPSNSYDGEGGSLVRGRSRSSPLLSVANPVIEHVVIADNIFLNAAHGALDPFISARSAETTVDIENNLFVNNVLTLKIGAGLEYRGHKAKVVNLRRNTFLLNWPYNPDPNSSNVGAVELHNSESARHLNIEGNIFAFNVGGALQHDWPEARMPKVTLRANLFYGNGSLFKVGGKDDAAIVGKFGLNPKHIPVTAAALAEDFSYEVAGNVSVAPGIALGDSLVVTKEDEEDEEAHDLKVKGYAPAVAYDPANPPLPAAAEAKAFGASADRAWPEAGK